MPDLSDEIAAARPKVYGYCLKLTGCPDEADEIAQEATVRGLLHQRGFRGGSNVSSWLCAIAYRSFLDHRRNVRSREIRMADVDLSEAAEDLHFADDIEPRTLRAIAKLPAWEIAAFWMVCGDESLQYREAAERLGVNVSTIKTRIWRARQRLQAVLCPN